MARIQKTVMVCDVCGQEVETIAIRLAGASGNVRNADVCDTCQGKPLREVMAKVGAIRPRGAGRRPATITADQLEALKAARKLEEAAAKRYPKRTPRKAAEVKD
jgi:hypothetical protein